ncbi:MAG: NAD-dependent epimerase/dehydratase family protein [Clostridiales bacterium]|nr:NAD-dependent epimerase/dehydratase family protein [Clostridiales bacterium]
MNLFEEDIKCVATLNYAWNKLKNRTVLISGGTGFIGQFIIEVIKYRNLNFGDNIKIISLSRHPLNNTQDVIYLKQDVTESVNLEQEIDFILHLASNTHPKQYAAYPVDTIITNVSGCYNLLDLAVKKKARFLLASSVEIYGSRLKNAVKEEDCGYIDCNTARAGYNEGKRVSESLCQSFKEQHGADCVIARLARIFGPDKKQDSKAIAQFFERAINSEDIILKSRGLQRFSYCYVADAVSGILKVLLDGQNGHAYNISEDDEGKSLKDYASLIAGFAGRKVVFDLNADNAGVSVADFAILNCDKLKSLGWQPLYSPSEAMQRTFRILKS